MISFTLNEIIASIFSAFIYGAIFSIFITMLQILLFVLKDIVLIIPSSFKGLFIKHNSLDNGKLNFESSGKRYKKFKMNFLKILSNVFSYIRVSFIIFAFTSGYILLSYYSLDGELRLYMLFISIITIEILKKPMSSMKSFGLIISKKISTVTIFLLNRVLKILLIPVFLGIKKLKKCSDCFGRNKNALLDK